MPSYTPSIKLSLHRWKSKTCCVKKGGPPNPPSPPEGTKCPPKSHYWHPGKDCCAPRNPYEPGKPPVTPECEKGWEWKPSEHKCKPCATPPSPPPHHPSPKPGDKKDKDKDEDKGKDKDKSKDDKDK